MPLFLSRAERRMSLVLALAAGLIWLGIYTTTVSPGVNFIDSGELITTLNEPGVAHPPGYPLYTLTGHLLTRLPVGEIAWRVNMLSTIWGALAIAIHFLLILAAGRYLLWRASTSRTTSRERTPRRRASKSVLPPTESTEHPTAWKPDRNFWLAAGGALAGATLLAASSTFWSRTAQAKLYTLHYAFIAFIFLCALNARWALERKDEPAQRRWLLALALAIGFSFTNHLMTLLVLPAVLILLFVGEHTGVRYPISSRRWLRLLPALVLPLALYLYLPLRSAQDPLMNWGDPSYSLGDLWRHLTGWQYGAYFSKTPLGNIPRLLGYMSQQWGPATWLLVLISFASLGLLAARNWTLALATGTKALITFFFATLYSISEIEPYLVGTYIMLAVWLGLAPVLVHLFMADRPEAIAPRWAAQAPVAALALLAVLATVLAALQYPQQNHSRDRLAEQFSRNVFSELPEGSILLTDYWDFYAPTLYLQNVRGERPDLTIIDTSLVRYPWYTGYLQRYRPGIFQTVQDAIAPFGVEQRRWINGEPFNESAIQSLYFGIFDALVERNISSRPVFTLWQACPPGVCDSSEIATRFARRRVGLTTRLYREQPDGTTLPDEPRYALNGLLDRSVPLDEFAQLNSCFYLEAYASVGQQYEANGPTEAAERMSKQFELLENALGGRENCRDLFNR
jgi:hypothetical protein